MTDIEVESLIETLRQFAEAYPEDIFRPLTDEEIKRHSNIITRNSAAMGRHMSKFTTKAADAIEQLQRELEEARRDAERYRCLRDRQTGESGSLFVGEDTGFGEGYPRIEGEELDAFVDAARKQKG